MIRVVGSCLMDQQGFDPSLPSRQAAEYLKSRTVARMLDISTRTLYRKVASGEFPRPVRIGRGTTRWRLRDIEAHLAKLKAR
jgi:predicted DNA-binding transcriptional regulator AlpA